MKTVLFLGAGFSRAWGLPVMQEFFQHAKDSDYLKPGDKDFLRELQSKAQRGVSMLQVGYDNLEEILSFCLASKTFNAGYPNQGDDEYDKLCNILQEVYRHIDMKKWWKENDGLLEKLKRLFGIGIKSKLKTNDLSIITTNYDVMIEFILSKLGWHCYLPGEWEAVVEDKKLTVSGQMCSDNKSHPLLCKLHGSLNWYFEPDDATKFQVENAILGGYTPELQPKQFYLPKVSFENYKPISTPLIVPPTLFKMQTNPIFRVIWNEAGKALEEAEKLVFIGFSFPESDIYIRYFLAANLFENVDLRPIAIVDPNADKIDARLKDSNFGTHFTKRLRPIKGKWEETDYCVVD